MVATRALKPAPMIQGRKASIREKLGSIIAGRDLYLPGEHAYYREDHDSRFSENEATRLLQSRIGRDPLAFARKTARLFKADHDKLDKLGENRDALWNEMDHDALIVALRGQIEDALARAEQKIECSDQDMLPFLEDVAGSTTVLTEDVRARGADSYTRGFVLGEMLLERMRVGKFGQYDTIGEIRRLEADAYRIEEDEWSRPSGLEINVLNAESYNRTQRARQLAGYRRSRLTFEGKPWKTVVIEPGDVEWERYLFLTWPPRSGRIAGMAAYLAAWPWYYFSLHLRQWMMVLGERTGTPILYAQYVGIPAGQTFFQGAQYPTTREDVFDFLEEIQTSFRGVLPPGYDIQALQTNAQGLGMLLQTLIEHCRRMIELAIVRQTVSGGGEATGGTLGANQTIFTGTFGGLIEAQLRREGATKSRLLEFLVRWNFGRDVRVKVTHDSPDPLKEEKRQAAAEKGVNLGLINRHEPWLRSLFQAPPVDDTLLEETKEVEQRVRAFGLAADMPSPSEAAAGAGAPVDTDKVATTLDQLRDGEIGERMAALMISKTLQITLEEATDVVQDEVARVGGVPPPTPKERVDPPPTDVANANVLASELGIPTVRITRAGQAGDIRQWDMLGSRPMYSRAEVQRLLIDRNPPPSSEVSGE